MASTSYSPLPSSSYLGLGSQGDLLHAANYGTYDSGLGSITAQPYQYQTTNFGTYASDSHQPSSYSNDFLQSTYANDAYSTQHHPSDRYAQQPNDYTKYQTERFDVSTTVPNNTDNNYPTQPPHKTTMNNHHVESNNQHQTSHTEINHHHSPPSNDNQHRQTSHNQTEHNNSNHSLNHNQTEHNNNTNHPSAKHQQSQSLSHSNLVRSEQQISHQSPKQLPVRHRSSSNGGNGYTSETATKQTKSSPEMRTTKSTKMRAAAIKQKEETRDKKQKDGNFPASTKKPSPTKTQPPPPPPPARHPPPRSDNDDDDENKKDKSKRNKKQSHSVPKHKSRRDNYQTEDNYTSADDDTRDHHKRNKSKKRTAISDSHKEKYPDLPPVRRGRGPPFYDPAFDYPFPSGHPLRERYQYYDDYPPYPYPHPYPYPYPSRHDYRRHHLYEDAYDAPPYIAAYPDPYDGFFDYEKRKSKTKTKPHKDKKDIAVDRDSREGLTGNETEHDDDSKSEQSKKPKNRKHVENRDEHHDKQHPPRSYYDAPYYDGGDMLEVWRQERNDYLKKKFKPSVHDVLYAQQWMKSDSYLENQRRRALRDSQGYYFPYKKYTLQDYKDLQKMEAQHNPYATIPEVPLDRKERAKKRQEYASQIERHAVDAAQNRTPRDGPPKKPWHSSNGDAHDPDKASKRERALEYAKVQVVKHRPSKAPKNKFHRPDPTEQYVDSLFPHGNDDGEGSVNGRDRRSDDDDDDQ